MAKRLFDIFFAALALWLVSPIFLLCIALVKLSSPGPVFYAHARIGYGGRSFGCYKFRTMHVNADAKLKLLLAHNPSLMEEWKTYFKLKVDPRITAVGKFLRKTSLDELPQLWNVLKGEMSIVGPRPLTQHEVTHYLRDKAKKILSLRPGLTTLWITQGRNDLSLEERIHLEEVYVNERSFWLDLKLIFQTVLIMIFPKGAY
ncbi:MAG: exopolysaccharide biosynthesis protein [Chlamydiae bacterium RIFCSPHIGHO2_12_FULL_44_59]|nr:MAG: exopolysaccharide biosynthesis protein [Chlamydiae bacterium RIFCSPHIGHO2_01_FULL_44_39]OGN59069.1 MAG: exopolysaccharide biosynthesis protein [Chlamydiae bacterium RIFCSPHIGHO2_02_FULL_45_9]OGN60265.1 MAG: exopolysaccharide biosynthesis protein [Chlamydiae bacterium RIFCSPHIGHO2_12_FULL_44_59]OGN67082.1 MAG: exopolysaccharide biosynthesis protein [Chlamydiae bacterium RIFCSPLOWO2_01_FULL_44_52]OGN67672.1 MAG: exopolysaccharide biosynthesis protein [Chlamydiae bacterium RIFCSPLOWO2_02_F